MALDINIRDASAGTPAEVDTTGNLLVTFPGHDAFGAETSGGPAQGPAAFMENDPGTITGTRRVASPEVTEDYQLRVAHDHLLDRETFNYTSQNTGKHSYTFTTMTATVSANGLLCNALAITTASTGFTFGSHAEFPCAHAAATTYFETNMSIGVAIASIPANFIMDIGAIRRGAAAPFAPLDGVYFRFSPAGISAVLNRNGTETVQVLTGVSGFLANENHRYTISVSENSADFWIDNVLHAQIQKPVTQGQVILGTTLPWGLRVANVGAPASAVTALVTDYTVSYGGAMYSSSWAQIGNRSLGAYQGLSGNAMGSLAANVTNNTNPTAAVPSNTALTANLPNGIGGLALETDTLAVNTDGIIMSYQVPAGSVSASGRRLVISGFRMDSFVQTALTGGGYNDVIFLCFGGTTVNLTTTESPSWQNATAKIARRVVIGSRTVASAAPVLTQLQPLSMQFANPIYVNPGEFLQVVKRKVGTAPSAGAIMHCISFDYGWE